MYSLHALLVSTGTVALAEIGDKTQLLAILLATRFKRPMPIVAGIFVATLANHFLAALVGERRVNWSAVAIWLAGVACYHLCAQLAPGWGAALPTLALTFVLARLTRPAPRVAVTAPA